MLLGFKRQFANYVAEGSKTHTIRAVRTVAPRVGETCHCYVDPRQKSMRLLGRWPVVRVQEIRIEEIALFMTTPLRVTIDGVRLEADEANALFYRDGFRDRGGEGPFAAMCSAADFWARRLPFAGHLIHWDFDKPVRQS